MLFKQVTLKAIAEGKVTLAAPVGDMVGSARINVGRARAAGLAYRPLARSAWDVLEWWHSDAVTDERRQQAWSGGGRGFPLHEEREREIIAAWRRRG